ncbi:uncharacterized protein LOC126681816 [Mercurialis annua]|uniref:uncharacterized protein LOC126681816 n=1 Tax=Mercurialis annua TaxID=3986 RepID=UPI002160022F|nr:uncharacterized protein LOC126681816 [Mercurialis annua]
MRFTTRDQLRSVVQQWALLNGQNVGWVRSAKIRLEDVCSGDCSWRLHASKIGGEKTFRIRRVSKNHTCPRAMTNRQATSEWIAKEFIQRFRRNPMYVPAEMMLDVKDRYNSLSVSRSTCYRARDLALQLIQGSLETHSAQFRSYDAELKRVDTEGLFSFFFHSQSRQSGSSISEVLLVGALLSAVARDSNNQMFPVAWAIVEAKKRRNMDLNY